jgi:hypothetical protein
MNARERRHARGRHFGPRLGDRAAHERDPQLRAWVLEQRAHQVEHHGVERRAFAEAACGFRQQRAADVAGFAVPGLHVEQHDADVAAWTADNVEQVGFAGAFQGVAGDAEESALEGKLAGVGFSEGCGQDARQSAKVIPTGCAEPSALRGGGLCNEIQRLGKLRHGWRACLRTFRRLKLSFRDEGV